MLEMKKAAEKARERQDALVAQLLKQQEQTQEQMMNIIEQQKEEILEMKFNKTQGKSGSPITASVTAMVPTTLKTPSLLPPVNKKPLTHLAPAESESLNYYDNIDDDSNKISNNNNNNNDDDPEFEQLDTYGLVLSKNVQPQPTPTAEHTRDSLSLTVDDDEDDIAANFAKIGEILYLLSSDNAEANRFVIKQIFKRYPQIFAPILRRCPNFSVVLAHMLQRRLGFRVQEIDWKHELKDWSKEDYKRAGRAFQTIMRFVQTGDAAIDGWSNQYPQLTILFDEVPHFDSFMLVLANNSLRDSRYAVMFRVSVGAMLSTTDAATDIYVIATYLQSAALVDQAMALLAMIMTNILF